MINQTEFKASDSELLDKTRSEANLILKLLIQGEADIQNNRTKPQEQVFSGLRTYLKARADQ